MLQSAAADVALLQRLARLCPELGVPADGTVIEESYEDWSITLVDKTEEEDAWLLADMVANFAPDKFGAEECQHAAAIAATAASVDRELCWYLSERNTRLFARRCTPTQQADARTVLIRKLLRYVATGLRAGDVEQLKTWCVCLQRIIDARLFTSNNWLWTSRFEQSLGACLVRFEGLRLELDSDSVSCTAFRNTPEQQVRAGNAECVAKAVARREAYGTSRRPRCEHFAFYRYAAKVERSVFSAKRWLPTWMSDGRRLRLLQRLTRGIPNLALLESLMGRFMIGLAGVQLTGQLAGEFHAYKVGELDEGTLAEDTLVSLATASAFALWQFSPVTLAVGGWSGILLLDFLGPSCAALAAGAVIRTAGRAWHGSQEKRALAAAYESLGLSRTGASLYTNSEIEAQLEWALRQSYRDPVQVMAAYEYIRSHQHPELRPCDSDRPRPI